MIAFSPQTFVDAENRQLAGDTRWPSRSTPCTRRCCRAATLDLLEVLPEALGKTQYQVHVSSDDPLDSFTALPIRPASRSSSMNEAGIDWSRRFGTAACSSHAAASALQSRYRLCLPAAGSARAS